MRIRHHGSAFPKYRVARQDYPGRGRLARHVGCVRYEHHVRSGGLLGCLNCDSKNSISDSTVHCCSTTLTRAELDSRVSNTFVRDSLLGFAEVRLFAGTDSIIFRLCRTTVEAAVPVSLLCVSIQFK